MVKKLSSIVLVFSLALNLAFVGVWSFHRFYLGPRGSAPPGRRPPRGGFRRHRGRKLHGGGLDGRLDLEPGQREAVRKARRALMKKMRGIGGRIDERRGELFELLMQKEPDRKSIRKKVEALSDTRAELTWATVNHILELKELLNPKQQRRLLKLIRKQTHGHGSAFRDHVGGRKRGRRHRRKRGGDGKRRRRKGPHSSDSRGPRRPGRKR